MALVDSQVMICQVKVDSKRFPCQPRLVAVGELIVDNLPKDLSTDARSADLRESGRYDSISFRPLALLQK